MKFKLNQQECNRIDELDKIRQMNAEVLEMYANYLRNDACFITKEMVEELTKGCGITEEEAYILLFGAACGLDTEENEKHKQINMDYFIPSIKKLDIEVYRNNPYYKNIKLPSVSKGKWQLKYETTKPYEAFIYNNILLKEDFKEIPRLGFFDQAFAFPAVLESGIEWMTITPNEIESQKEAIDTVSGKVITFGLGLGYFAYMVSEKSDVESITVIERDALVISLFKEYILPQFPNKEKVRIIQMDAFEYIKNEMSQEGYDYAFVDIWHDVADGIDLYLQMKKVEHFSPNTKYLYWIEEPILSNLRFCVLEVLLDQFVLCEENGLIEAMEQMSTFKMPENRYEQKHRQRLESIFKYFKDKEITSYEEFKSYLDNESLRRIAKII